MTLTQNGREYSYAYTIDSCASGDPTCSAPITSIDHQGVGLIMLPGDNPTTIYSNATTVKALYDALVPMGQGDVPAYLTQLAAAAPANWPAISLAMHSFAISDGVNCAGPQCAGIDGHFFNGVIPTYTLPEPTAAAGLFAVLGALSVVARRRTRIA